MNVLHKVVIEEVQMTDHIEFKLTTNVNNIYWFRTLNDLLDYLQEYWNGR